MEKVVEAVVEVAVKYATVGEVEADKVVPSELSQPCPNEVCPVPPLATARVPVMLDKVEVASQVGTPADKAKT